MATHPVIANADGTFFSKCKNGDKVTEKAVVGILPKVLGVADFAIRTAYSGVVSGMIKDNTTVDSQDVVCSISDTALFALYGKGDSGKSSTILDVINQLTVNGAQVISAIKHGTDADSDQTLIMNVNNCTVGITSRGDDATILQNDLNSFIANNCKVILCPSRTVGQTVDFLTKFSDDSGIGLIWVQKTTSQNDEIHDAINSVDTNFVLNKIISSSSLSQ
jgi:hypothetical protein